MNSIKTFLAKPIVVSSVTWTTTSPQGTQLVSQSVGALLSTTIYKNKLAGYRYIRGTAVFRLVLNAQPFQQGKLIMHFLPCYSSRSAFDAYVGHLTNLCTITQQTSVEIDCRQTSVVMRIPYITPAHWYDLSSNAPFNPFDWGTVFVTVLSPVATTDSHFTLYASFEDIELAGPMSAEMNVDRKGKSFVKKERRNLARDGIISGTLENLRNPIQAFSRIPGAGGLVSIADSVLDGAAGIASVFGWSRPLDARAPQVVKLDNGAKNFHFNGVNTSTPLTMDCMNSLDKLENFGGTSEDEMSFTYLKKIPAYIATKNWDTTNASGVTIYSTSMDPVSLTMPVVGTYNNVCAAPPCNYIARFFKYYRGGYRITLKFVKTQYHSGRLSVTFNADNAPMSLTNSNYVFRDIIDIAKCNEVSFDVPFVSYSPYNRTGWDEPVSEYERSFGTFTVMVSTPLVAIPSVSSSISMLVYVSALDDFELYFPFSTPSVLTAEMGGDDNDCLTCKSIGDAPTNDLTLAPSMTCAGEVFVSLKQLLQMPRLMKNAGFFFNNTPNPTYSGTRFIPWARGLPVPSTTVRGSYSTPVLGGDYITEISQGFAFERGGLRFLFPFQPSTYGDVVCTLVNSPGGTPPIATSPISIHTNSPALTLPGNWSSLQPQLAKSGFGGSFDVIVPHSSRYPFRLTYCDITPLNQWIKRPDVPTTYLNFYRTTTNDAQGLLQNIYRAGADDYALGYFIGFPTFISQYITP